MNAKALLLAGAATLLSGSIALETIAAPTVMARFDTKKKKKKAKRKKGKEKEEKADPAKPTPISKRVKLSYGVKWEMSPKKVKKRYDKVFEKQFVPLYKKAQPGPATASLDAELSAKKREFMQSLIKFGTTPTGIDNSALKGEYTYRNKEKLAYIRLRSGTKRNFFFIRNKLWKIYDERSLRKGSKLGKSFKQAVKRLTKSFGKAPLMVEADPAKGVNFAEAQWSDGRTIIRAVDRDYEKIIGLVYMHKSTAENIDDLRTNKPKDTNKLDKDVAMVTREPVKEDKKSDKKKKGKSRRKK